MYNFDFSIPQTVYFIGIGGISMSGLAEFLLDRGFKVYGSDSKESSLTDSLSDKGAVIFYDQSVSHIPAETDCVIYTAAINSRNAELVDAGERNIPLLTRAELLGQVMKLFPVSIAVSGTHGKTTTTSMISDILLEAGTDPTLSIGGILPTIGSNFRVGQGSHFVTEACEYTNSFLSFFPSVEVILNIEADHLDFFKDLDDIRASFKKFAELLPDTGLLIINGDIPDYKYITSGLNCKIITVGTSSENDYYAEDISFDSNARASFYARCNIKEQESSRSITLGVPGIHNVYNSLAAIALADELGINYATLDSALRGFKGSCRRFEYKGEYNGFSIYDDYAHHPTEINATISTALQVEKNELWVIFQPHTYTRTKALMDDFALALSKADHVILADIYAARETDTLGISSADLAAKINALGTDSHYFSSFAEIENYVKEKCTKNDLLITMGAGDVVNIGESLLTKK